MPPTRVIPLAVASLLSVACIELSPLKDVASEPDVTVDADAADAAEVPPGSDADAQPDVPTLVPRIVDIQSGGRFSLLLWEDGSVEAWGYGQYGELTDLPFQGTGRRQLILEPADAIAVGRYHACILDTSRRVWCWGRNDWGQVGVASPAEVHSPVVVLDDAVTIHAGGGHTCASTSDGVLVCWGRPLDGYESFPKAFPDKVDQEVFKANDVHLGDDHVCALESDGTLWCWGENSLGALGVGKVQEFFLGTPQKVTSRVAIIGGGLNHQCAVQDDGDVLCWGHNDKGQAGVGLPDPYVFDPTPVDVPTTAPIVSIRGGESHNLLLDADGRVFCSGDDTLQLCHAFKDETRLPLRQTLVPAFDRISSGDRFACGVAKRSDDVWCWGGNALGQLGVGSTSSSSPPVLVPPPPEG